MFTFDQILEGSDKQDNFAITSIMETCLLQLHEELPQIKQVILQSDNVGCYQSSELLVLFGILNGVLLIKVARFIHTETQDGKGLIDAHFARGTSHLKRFMKTF